MMGGSRVKELDIYTMDPALYAFRKHARTVIKELIVEAIEEQLGVRINIGTSNVILYQCEDVPSLAPGVAGTATTFAIYVGPVVIYHRFLTANDFIIEALDGGMEWRRRFAECHGADIRSVGVYIAELLVQRWLRKHRRLCRL
jgi:hypothetical protein